MNGATLLETLRERMPDLRGRLTAEAPLSDYTWFRVGGPAEVLYSPADEADLAYFLNNLPKDVPVTMIGLGSNLLVRDGGIAGVVIRLGRGFGEIKVEIEESVAKPVPLRGEALMNHFAIVESRLHRNSHGSPPSNAWQRMTAERKPSSWNP